MSVSDLLTSRSRCPRPGLRRKLFTLAYDELKRLAIAQMNRERKDHTLTPTALLHEAYLRVCNTADGFASMTRVQFFAFAAESDATDPC